MNHSYCGYYGILIFGILLSFVQIRIICGDDQILAATNDKDQFETNNQYVYDDNENQELENVKSNKNVLNRFTRAQGFSRILREPDGFSRILRKDSAFSKIARDPGYSRIVKKSDDMNGFARIQRDPMEFARILRGQTGFSRILRTPGYVRILRSPHGFSRILRGDAEFSRIIRDFHPSHNTPFQDL
uniref:Uncharacterized protein n=1 Tax=Lepeophtheirus salmonis TaxID=72036 RepID=A0A0K2TXG1_LEPSM